MDWFHTQPTDQRIQIPCSEPSIHFRDFCRKLACIALTEAAKDSYLSELSVRLGSNCLEYCIDRLFLCISNKSAGVEQQYVGRTVVHYLEAILRQHPEKVLGVNRILGTTECNDPDASHRLSLFFSCCIELGFTLLVSYKVETSVVDKFVVPIHNLLHMRHIEAV